MKFKSHFHRIQRNSMIKRARAGLISRTGRDLVPTILPYALRTLCQSGFIDRSGNCPQPYDIHQLPGLQLRRPVPSSGINRPPGSGSSLATIIVD